MAISAPSLLTVGTSQSSVSSVTTASITPTADSLLLVLQCTGNISTTTFPTFSTPTTTLSGLGTWNVISLTGSGTRYWRVGLWYVQCGATPGTGTITLRTTSSYGRHAWMVAGVVGHDTASPLRQNNTGTGTSTTLSITLGTTPLTDSMHFGAVFSESQDGGINPGSGYTELGESGIVESNGHNAQMQYDLTPATLCNWSALTTQRNLGISYEIVSALPPPPPPPPPVPPPPPPITPSGIALLLESASYVLKEDSTFILLESAPAPPPPPPPPPETAGRRNIIQLGF